MLRANVGGMVTFSSADYLRLADGVRFNAIAQCYRRCAFKRGTGGSIRLLGSNPGAITVQGSQLSVADGTGISLVGGTWHQFNLAHRREEPRNQLDFAPMARFNWPVPHPPESSTPQHSSRCRNAGNNISFTSFGFYLAGAGLKHQRQR